MRSRYTVALLTAITLATATTLTAQVREPYGTAYPHFGLQASVGEDVDLGLGVRYENRMLGMFPESPNLRFALSFDRFFPDGLRSYWEVNANVFNLFQAQNARVAPYLGGGLNVAHMSNGGSDTDVGVNLLGGVRLPGRYRPYLEARIELGGGERLVVTGGWLFW